MLAGFKFRVAPNHAGCWAPGDPVAQTLCNPAAGRAFETQLLVAALAGDRGPLHVR